MSAAKPTADLVAELERQLSFTRALLSAIPNPVFFKDAEGRYLGCNRAFEEVMGVSSDQMRGKTVFELWPGNQAKVYHEKDLQLLRQPVRQVYEFQVTDKNGQIRPVIYGKDVYFDEQGRPAGIVGTFLDISDRKRAETALVEALSILNRSPAVAFRWRAAEGWPVEFVTENVAQLLGYSVAQFADGTVTYRDLVHPEDRERVADEVRVHSTTPGCVRFAHLPYRIVRPDGVVRWVDDSTYIRRNLNGEPEYYEGIVSDATVRVETEEALKRSEERYRVVSELSSDFAYALDVAPDGGLSVAWSTGGIGRLLGCAQDEVIGLADVLRAVHPDDQLLVQEQEAMIRRGEASRISYRLLGKAGQVRWVSDYARPVLDSRSGRLVQMVGAMQDITARHDAEQERLRLERQVQHAQKLESLGVLAGGIAHDFNNILMAILGNAELALQSISRETAAREHVEEIVIATKRASELARQMLAYSGKGRFTAVRLSLNEVVREMSQLLNVSIGKTVRLDLQLADGLPAFVGDPTQIRQVVLNLLTNASEAIGDRAGNVCVVTGVRHCDRAYLDQAGEAIAAAPAAPPTEGDYVFLEVSDDGAGIPAENLPKLFDPFFTTKFTGRGLGLSVVQGIVRGHHGLITVHPGRSGGATFRVLFPLDAQPAVAMEAVSGAAAATAWRGRGTVLVADDEVAVLSVTSQMLRHLGFQVLTARDGDEACAVFAARGSEIDCVLLDLTMPGLDSRAVLETLRAGQPAVKVLLTSGYSKHDATRRFGNSTLSGFLQKPFDLPALEALMRATLP